MKTELAQRTEQVEPKMEQVAHRWRRWRWMARHWTEMRLTAPR